MNKPQVEALIDRLADKTLSFGCRYISNKGHIHTIDSQFVDIHGNNIFVKSPTGVIVHENVEIIGHPIYLHRILHLISKLKDNSGIWKRELEVFRICAYWDKCGLEKSLQEIVEESGWEETVDCKEALTQSGRSSVTGRITSTYRIPQASTASVQLKSPEAQALFTYLEEIGL